MRAQAGITTRGWDYEQRAVVTHLSCERPHRATAWQRFLDTGPLALLPLADGRVSLVWSTTPALAEELVRCSEDDFAAQVTAASAGVLGRLAATTARASFPLRLLHARQYTAPRIALIGDAAHTVHPLAGQGINLAFMDAAALADVLGAALEAGDDPGEPLGRARRMRGIGLTGGRRFRGSFPGALPRAGHPCRIDITSLWVPGRITSPESPKRRSDLHR